jgi:hypothetical protein
VPRGFFIEHASISTAMREKTVATANQLGYRRLMNVDALKWAAV